MTSIFVLCPNPATLNEFKIALNLVLAIFLDSKFEVEILFAKRFGAYYVHPTAICACQHNLLRGILFNLEIIFFTDFASDFSS
jgi:hypothetical protein